MIGLAFDALVFVSILWYTGLKQALTQIHDVVSANGTVVDDNVPGPQSYSVPLDSIRLLSLFVLEGGTTFLTSNLFLPSGPVSAPDFADLTTLFDFAGAEGPASGMSTSAMASLSVMVFSDVLFGNKMWNGGGRLK